MFGGMGPGLGPGGAKLRERRGAGRNEKSPDHSGLFEVQGRAQAFAASAGTMLT
jgi:hypothetical protein